MHLDSTAPKTRQTPTQKAQISSDARDRADLELHVPRAPASSNVTVGDLIAAACGDTSVLDGLTVREEFVFQRHVHFVRAELIERVLAGECQITFGGAASTPEPDRKMQDASGLALTNA